MNFTKPFVSVMPSYKRETHQQAKNYNLAVQDLLSANILYNAGLYNDSCVLSEQAAEKFLKSCPDIITPYGHNVIDLYQQFSAVYGEHQCKEDDIRLLKTKFYSNRYGDQPGESSTESESLQCLHTACSIKEEIDYYRQTPTSDIFKFTGGNKPDGPVTDDYIRKNQFDLMRTYSQTLTTGTKIDL